MEGGATTGELIASFVYLIAGVRLIRLSRLTRERPERLLGSSLLFMGLGSLFYSTAELLALESTWTPLNFAGRISYVVASMLIAAFTRRVFRPKQRWGRWAIYFTLALFACGVAGSATAGDWEGFAIDSGWYWLEFAGYILPVSWTCAEATREYSRARRRRRVGLCEPLVCNRLLLWACFAALQIGGNLITAGQYAAYAREGIFTATWDYLYGATSIGSLAMMWIAFFPPGFYRRWIQASPHEEGAARS